MITMEKEYISKALEEYLEAIYTLSQKQGSVRITDIALYLGISKPSVNRAVNSLKSRGFVSHEPYGDIHLTEKGTAAGGSLTGRHDIIRKFLISVLELNDEDAKNESRRMAHIISPETVEKMTKFMEK